jgi:hypothetical protein
MSDRKYRQRGYQDDPRDRAQSREKSAPKPVEPRAPGRQLQSASGPKTPNLMASHEVFRCARCGNRLALPVEADGRCGKCGVALHSCVQCVSFDTSARFECAQPTLTARISPKDEKNSCALFAPRATIERQTSTPAAQSPETNSARRAFDDLFKI